jgi:prolyl oligopeptidase
MRYAAALLLLPVTACTVNDPAPPSQTAPAPTSSIVYPATERQDIVETHFGVSVADPYRWLEGDVRENPKVRQWVAEQNALTDSYLAALPARGHFRRRMTELFAYERFTAPVKQGGRYFYTRNTGLQNQNLLYLRDGMAAAPRLLIDPNSWSEDGTTAMAEWTPSKDGRHVLYAIQEGGSDWRVLKVLDVDSGRVLPDEIRWVKFSNLAWARNGSGFYYSRFPQPAGGAFQSVDERQAVYFHRLGTAQSEDRLVFAEPQRPRLNNVAEVSEDGRWLIVTGSEGTDQRYDISLIDLARPRMPPRRFVTGLANDWRYVGNRGKRFFWVTDRGAPRLRIVVADIDRPVSEARELVAEDAATLDFASIVGDRLIAAYLVDARTEVRTFSLDGRRAGKVDLPGIGSADGFKGDYRDSETFFSFTSFNHPTTIYRYDAATGRASVWAQPQVDFAPDDFEVEQRFYPSRDGTRIPIFLVHRKDIELRGRHPTLLYGYGGFNVPVTPAFSSTYLAWVEQGGVLAVANLRGGGEYGRGWHEAGRLAMKQNAFDDFIAAAEYLIAEGISAAERLAIYGRSNGGLLVAAVVNQRPDLFAAALPAVGVMDMLRFDRWTAGRYWVDDYGFPGREADFRTLRAYSPYHNIRSGADYPAILVTTADTDDRVVPGHSFKYVAALQAAETGGKPKLIRIETRAGHGSGKPTDKIIEEYADMWAFAAFHSGMEVGS